MLYEFLVGHPPYFAPEISEIFHKIKEGKIKYVPLGVDINKFYPVSFEDGQKKMRDFRINDNIIRFGIISKRYDSGKKGEDFFSAPFVLRT